MAMLDRLSTFNRTLRHINRYKEILTAFFRYGFGDALKSLGAEEFLGERGISWTTPESVASLSRAERLCRLLSELGPTAIKIGQFLSCRPDLVAPDLVSGLSSLQDRVEPFPVEEARGIIEADLRGPMDAIFEGFEPEPFAAASLGQAHRARLKDGSEVVVKVRRPGIQAGVLVDLEIIHHLAVLAERHLDEWRHHRPTRIVEEWAETLEKELDYSVEAAHMARFASQFADDPSVRVPKVYRKFSSSRVLVMEWIDGMKITDTAALEDAGLDPRETARGLADQAFAQVLLHGFFHADPHPGNLRIMAGGVVCYLDFGMMGRLDRKTRGALVDLMAAAARRDEALAAEAMRSMLLSDAPVDRRALRRLASELFDEFAHRPIEDVQLGKLLRRFLTVSLRFRLRLPPELFLMVKMLANLEEAARLLDPGLNLTERAAPFVKRAYRDRYDPRRLTKGLIDLGAASFRMVQDLPDELADFAQQLLQGRVKIQMEHRGLEQLTASHDRVSNRLSFAIVLASLIIGSSLIVLSGLPPTWRGIPVIGLGGYLLAAVMGFLLLASILRHGKM